VAGALLFVFHHTFYDGKGVTAIDMPLWLFAALVTVLYLFLRMAFIVAGMFFPRKRPEFVLCPECGRELDDASPHGVADHNRIALTPKPTGKEVLAAIMLRKAIEDARRSARRDLAGPRVEVPSLPDDAENMPVSFEELDRILARLTPTRGPKRGSDLGGPKGPPERPL
jgi:hypothetical protein